MRYSFVVFVIIVSIIVGVVQSNGIVNSGGAVWDGSFASYVGNNNFCSCQFGPNSCKYICAGGGSGGGGGGCPTDACTSGQYTFDATDGWAIQVNQAGNPYRAFAYAPLCGQNVQNNVCLTTSPSYLTFSFRFTNVSTWGGYIKILFFGDGNNVMGLWPNRGMQLVLFPNGDLPSNWQTQINLKEGVWYDVTVAIVFPSSLNISITENAATRTVYGGANYQGTVSALLMAQIGVYSWASAGPQFTMNLRNLCAGTTGQCAFTYSNSPPTTPPTTPPSSSTSSSPTTPTSTTSSSPTNPTSSSTSSPSSSSTSSTSSSTPPARFVSPPAYTDPGNATAIVVTIILLLSFGGLMYLVYNVVTKRKVEGF